LFITELSYYEAALKVSIV